MSKRKSRVNRKESGAISTLALFTVLMFLAILMGSYLITSTLLKSQMKSNLRIEQIYGQEVDKVDEIYEELALPRVANSKGTYFIKETTLEDSNGNKIVVPKGFKIAEDSGNSVTEGIVIEDDDIIKGVGENRGNQYVWIPVSNIDDSSSNPIIKSSGEEVKITLGRYTFDDNGKEKLEQKAEDYAKQTVIDTYYKELTTYDEGKESSGTDGLNATAKDLVGFINSVKENGGYYIAKYEASYGEDNKPNSKISDNFNNNETTPTQEGYLWNNITQINAAKVCENMYDTINSDLINSYAWDTAIVYIQKFSKYTNYSRQNSKNGTIDNTGKNNDEVCKINDMASNCCEWTTESFNEANVIVGRGGDYLYSHFYSSTRSRNISAYKSKDAAFRPILYIK